MTLNSPSASLLDHASAAGTWLLVQVNLLLTWVINLLPTFVVTTGNTVLQQLQTLLTERKEARILLVLFLLPFAAVLSVGLFILLAITWPLLEPLLLIGVIAGVAAYLFWPTNTDILTLVLSISFGIATQLLVVLPVYFFAPFCLFLTVSASAVYSSYQLLSSFTLNNILVASLSIWWLATTPYWGLIHFITFPPLFVASLIIQGLLSTGAVITLVIQRWIQSYRGDNSLTQTDSYTFTKQADNKLYQNDSKLHGYQLNGAHHNIKTETTTSTTTHGVEPRSYKVKEEHKEAF